MTALGGEFGRIVVGGLEVVSVLDQLAAEGAHGEVLLAAVAMRHDDGGGPSATAGSEGDTLSVIAAGGGDHAGEVRLLAGEPVHVDGCAAQLERADRGVVLVLDPYLGAAAGVQQRPGVGGRRRHHGAHELGRAANLVESGKVHKDTLNRGGNAGGGNLLSAVYLA